MKKIIFFLLTFPFFTNAQTYKAVYDVSLKAEDSLINLTFSQFDNNKVVIANSDYAFYYSANFDIKEEKSFKTPGGSVNMKMTSSTTEDASINFLLKQEQILFEIDTTKSRKDKIVGLKKIQPKFEVVEEKDTIIKGKTYHFLKVKSLSGDTVINYYFDPTLPKGIMPYVDSLGDKAPKGGVYKFERTNLVSPSPATTVATLISVEQIEFNFKPYLQIIKNIKVSEDKISVLNF
ncbi:hypothetical protein LX95_00572 [Mesonia algae]|uniref:GLPGLI family protein n=1 Tax=Mesonia algae TaxID=213248 RepID=A0A2W7IDT1_9FLAO|nr:hypothetical protein [Mesonia algae]PZW44238.1 hypothetical protein LX95_00572 [Mesonia algae]